jgi:hypothetical protein
MMAGRAAAIWLIAGFCSLAVAGRADGDIVGATADSGWNVTYALSEPPEQTSSADTWQAALILSLSGNMTDRDEIVAIVEGTLFTRVMVQAEPGREPGSREISLPIHISAMPRDTMPRSATAGNPAPSFHRIDIVFARLTGMRVTPFLKRSVYLTAGPRPERRVEAPPDEPAPMTKPDSPAQTVPAVLPDQKPLPGIERPPVAPVQDGAVSETDIMPPALKTDFQDYWTNIQERITARFGQRMGPRPSVPRKPRVQFRLYRDGVAQVIFLERSSGSTQVDRAGLDSVVEAHPFPAFPPAMTEVYVDVHVDFADAKQSPASKRRGKR